MRAPDTNYHAKNRYCVFRPCEGGFRWFILFLSSSRSRSSVRFPRPVGGRFQKCSTRTHRDPWFVAQMINHITNETLRALSLGMDHRRFDAAIDGRPPG